MRVLLMISNSNMSARELYGMVLRERHPGWGISNMSGLPISPATILKGFDVVVYELGAADDPRRYKAVLARVLEDLVAEGFCNRREAVQVARLILHDNAVRMYSL